ncbi:unnamed protein product (macronuclear) [Paramecium tetraurelia]|uniref:Letm1 RBD domain-containing protein n=1 Tax=Paramecium tetraurelia TaxID=5888 RepID=A0BC02_PARTE|nr:uncharacterized protein GSPATT00000505001 [Paramecium tetraurelia]CAK56069.1 unnamed protein product [Paramecium tetraurelia]|eukprot:XP_001423467.1 hypothetical protein (macronuclear) [Paramecium tetraurelia strain d4-2]
MLSSIIPKFRYYQRLKQHMDINQNIRKENLDIQRTYHKSQKPLWAKMKQKVEDNKNRIYLFCGLIFLCQLKFAYEIYLARIPYRRLLFNKFKSFFLGLESVYPRPIVEQVFKNELPQQLISKFIQLDDQLPMGVTKKFIVHCLTECQVTLSKEQKREFYQKHGFLYGIYSKNSGINLKELNNFLKNLNVDPQKLTDVFDTLRDQEIQFQNRVLQKMKQKQPQYSCNTPDAIAKRIQPYFDTI